MGGGAWQATVHGVAKSQTWLSDWTELNFKKKKKILLTCPPLLPCPCTVYHNATARKVKVKSFSRVRLFATPWTVACQAPPPMGFPRQEYWRGLPFPSPGDLPDPGIEPWSSTLQADSLLSEPPRKPTIATDPFKTEVWSHFCLLKAPKHPELLPCHQI